MKPEKIEESLYYLFGQDYRARSGQADMTRPRHKGQGPR